MSDGFIGDIATCPDLIGQVLGVRGFDRAGHFLASPFQGDPWHRPTRTAVCQPNRRATAAALTATGTKPRTAISAAQRIIERQRTRPDHDAPGVGCSCGLYAYHDVEHLTEHLPCHRTVAAVHAWGELVVHPRGFRAQRMRIVALAVPDDLRDDIAADRLAEATRRAAAWWQIPLLGLDEFTASLRRVRRSHSCRAHPRRRQRGDRPMTHTGPGRRIVVEPLEEPAPAEPAREPAPNRPNPRRPNPRRPNPRRPNRCPHARAGERRRSTDRDTRHELG